MAVANITRQIASIRKSAEKMHAAATERIEAPSVGDVVRQGDVYLICIAALPSGLTPAKSRQLAPGITQGSRHIADGECTIYSPSQPSIVARAISDVIRGAEIPDALIGPVIECRCDTTITHPEHGHRVLPAGTWWATVYQRAYATEARRVQD